MSQGKEGAMYVNTEGKVEIEMGNISPRARTNSREAEATSTSTWKDPKVAVEFRTLSHRITTEETYHHGKDKKKEDDKTEGLESIDVHKLKAQDVFLRYSSHPTRGLEGGILERLEKDSKPNSISPPKTNYLLKALFYVFGGFNSLMWLAMIVTIISYEPLGGDSPQVFNLGVAVLIFLVILASSVFYALVDFNSSQVMKAIMGLVADKALVLRNGEKTEIPAVNIHQGDVILLSMGQRVPADLYLFEVSADLKFDKSLLTGESDPISGSTEMTDENPLETRNLALSSTFVVQGSAKGIVFAIGDETVVGRIVALSAKQKPGTTNLQKEINRFTMVISFLAIFFFLLAMFVWGVITKAGNASSAILNAIGMLTAFVPQGLPVCVALALSIIARRMAARSVLVKNLSTVETVGSMNLLCSDKTGTLTQGKMVVEAVGYNSGTGNGNNVEMKQNSLIQAFNENKQPLVGLSVRAAYLCNDAAFEDESSDSANKEKISERGIRGNSTDVAVLRFACSVNPTRYSEWDDEYPRIYVIPFNSKNKWMLTLHKCPDGTYELYMKGAPDILLKMCTRVMGVGEGNVVDLGKEQKDGLLQQQEAWSRQGQRVILTCYKPLGKEAPPLQSEKKMEDFVKREMSEMIVLSLIGIRDPPRPDVPKALKVMREAGVRVFMVTGDFKLTAESIARQIGLITSETVDSIEVVKNNKELIEKYKKIPLYDMHPYGQGVSTAIPVNKSLVITGSELHDINDDHWNVIFSVYNEVVFARTSPEQKMMIVEEAKKRGDNVVGVTGDGVNDAPALKAADIGLAMGAGSDVAKEAAVMILLNNDFESIPVAIENGRLVFENLKKVILYVMPAGTYAEAMAVISNVFFGLPIPLSAYLQVIFSILNDVTMSISLMFESAESDLMRRKPRNIRVDRLTDWRLFVQLYLFLGVFIWVTSFGMYFLYFADNGYGFYDLMFLYANNPKGDVNNFNNVLLPSAQAVYYVAMTVMQLGSIMAIRNRRVSVLESNPFFGPRRNYALLICMTLHLVVSISNVYISNAPGVNNIFQIGPVPAKFWFIPIPCAAGLLLADEIRKYFVRQYPDSWIGKAAW